MNAITAKNDTLAIILHELERDPAIKSKHTRRGYGRDLAEFEAWRAGRPLTKLLVGEYAAGLQAEGRAPASINRKLAAIRWWARRLAELAFEGDMSDQDRREIITQAERAASVHDVSGDRHEKTGRHISAGEISAVMAICLADNSPAGFRDAAIFALLRAGGLRRGELTGLGYSSVIPAEGDTFDLLVHGKGDKTRIVPINNGAALALRDWLSLRGAEDGPLFCAIGKGGRVKPDQGLSGDALRQLHDKRCEAAGVPHMALHDWRRTFAGDLLDREVDIVTVADLMGHASVSTTQRYDRRGDARKRRAVDGLFVPYRERS